MSKYTPGPWKERNSLLNPVIISEERLSLSCGVPTEEAKFNGKLVILAPELLETLERVVDLYSHHGEVPLDLVEEAESLIREAKGD